MRKVRKVKGGETKGLQAVLGSSHSVLSAVGSLGSLGWRWGTEGWERVTSSRFFYPSPEESTKSSLLVLK